MAGTSALNADIHRLTSLAINTVYSNENAFLRELSSNALGALDRIRYVTILNLDEIEAQFDLYAMIIPDRTNSTVTIEGPPFGMMRHELINDVGTIALPGMQAFMEALATGGNFPVIRRFGVGFYTAYLVPDMVRVVLEYNDYPQRGWESGTGGSFPVPMDTTLVQGEIKRGARIISSLKEDLSEFLEERRLEDLVK